MYIDHIPQRNGCNNQQQNLFMTHVLAKKDNSIYLNNLLTCPLFCIYITSCLTSNDKKIILLTVTLF